ncbi:hypothetical protein [Myceligenerans indicum]|uniref:DUF308 domain-containing protein n=1 Tax=Myceligenerans indicum TaxID=2593663 RepID=A0ABS1LLC3_9MICO|nr:hypothetical protein [Myceligenerans indicum]MBL0886578.1 hypothetical protein [Myceligenerans indicum]
MAASNTDDRDDDLPDEPTPPADRSEDAGGETNDHAPGTGELPDETVDARFADLVASLGDLGTSATGPATRTSLPDASDPRITPKGAGDPHEAGDDPGPTAPAGDAGSPTAPPARASGPRDWPVTPEVEALEEAESHFTPPEPEPLLSDKDPLLTMAWIAVAGIPVLALLSVIAVAAIPALHIPALVGQVALGLFVAGLGVLLWRMPHHRDPEDDDPGAVV